MSRRCAGCVLGTAAALFCLAALAGEPAGDTDLEKKVKELEKRLSDLEKRGGPQAPPAEGKDNLFTAYWKDGLRLETADKQFQFRLGGRVMTDWAFVEADDDVEAAVGEQEDGVEFRRARIDVRGLLYKQIEFRAEWDFAGGDADFKNVYIGLLGVPVVGNIRVGIFEQPISLNKMDSSKYITFMERSLATALVPHEDTGVMVFDQALGGRMTWAVGAFRDTDSAGNDKGNGYSVAARVTGLPWYQDKGKRLVHVGVDFCHGDTGDDTLRFRSRPEAHLVDYLIDTGDLDANSADIVVAELAAVCGPLSVQGEYVHAFVNDVDSATFGDEDMEFRAFYVLVSCFLTGEHRPYSMKEGTFGRVRPRRNFGFEDGAAPGAWEVGLRYSHMDLDNKYSNGGELDDITVGLNWYLNPNTRIMFNYVFADVEGVGDVNIFQLRFQVDF